MTTPPIPPDEPGHAAAPDEPGHATPPVEQEHATPPDGPGEPANVWAPRTPANVWAPRPQATPLPVHPPSAYPPSAFPAPAHPTSVVPPQRTSRVGLVIAISLGVLLVAMLSTVLYALPGDSTPSPAVGDCVKLTGLESAMKYEKVSCDGRLHNYTVSKVLFFQTDDCGDDPGAYTTYHSDEGFNGEHLCLIPVFFDGECYDFMLASHVADNPVVDCGATGAVKVRVLTNTADKAACGADALKAMAYRETKTTYCFTRGS